jgi:glucan phosphoethanolaminetransferase (alkaline phosphatase superfamily)
MTLEIAKSNWNSRNKFLFALKLIAISALILSTNPESWTQFNVLLGRRQFVTLLPFIAIWGASAFALLVVAVHHKAWLRLFWGTLIAASTAITWGYYLASRLQWNVYDMMSLWNVRHEAGRAAGFYGQQMLIAAIMFVVCIFIFLFPVPTFGLRARRFLRSMSLIPVLPIAMIASVFWYKNGSTYIPMPSQFSSVSLASLLGYKISTNSVPVRQEVSWQPSVEAQSKKAKNIIYIVDESVRGDYIDLTPGNKLTPKFATLADKFVNFGPAVSGGDCSNYSNSILRFGVTRKNLIASATLNPTLFQYAKKAGYRTVYIDAEAHLITDKNFLQNFMTVKEREDIDGFYPIHELPPNVADQELARIISEELKSGKPIFVYANKNGTHTPYDNDYPATATLFHPTMKELGKDTVASLVASYRNALSWSVDNFMADFFANIDLSTSTIIYTSDHGQRFEPGKITHCQVENPDPRMGIVPLMAYSSDPEIRAKFEKGAALISGKASHFQIAPTLYNLMGYAPADIATSYDESLFDGTSRTPEMTTGDIFGVFSQHVNVTPVDPTKPYMENIEAEPAPQVQ